MTKRNESDADNQKQILAESQSGNNPWVRVIENCEMNADKYVGTKDVSRMRSTMISRKADITK